jgi:hypothetical protein
MYLSGPLLWLGWRKATSRACASGTRLLMVLSVVCALIALAPSCSPVGGRSGSFSLRMSYEGRRGAMRDSGLRSAKGRKLYSRW